LIAADGTTTQTVTETTLPASALTMTPIFLTDETGYPSNFCPYTGSDLYNVAAYLCWQRTSGAHNWEAWIKDSRDNELYRIVFLPNNKWWTAEEMRYDASATKQSYKCPNEDMRIIYNNPKVACPTGWSMPSLSDFASLSTFMSRAELLAEGTHQYWGDGVDKYGWTMIPSLLRGDQANATYPSGNCRTDGQPPFIHVWGLLDGKRLAMYGENIAVASQNWSWDQVRCIREL
jgi:uncharacterized protein (TIGR02145 family)